MDKRQDDYLATKEYQGHERSSENNDFSLFEKDGEFYFAMLNKDGDVVLRSEGYTSAKGRDNGVASVIKNRAIEGRVTVLEYMNKFFVSLKAGNNQEIGRSGAYDTKGAAEASMGSWMLGAGAAIAGAGAAITSGELKVISVTRNEIGETRNLLERKLTKENRKDLGEKSRKVVNTTRNQISENRNQISETRNVTKKASVGAIAAMAAPAIFSLKSKTAFEAKAMPARTEAVEEPVEDPNRGFAKFLPLLLLLLIPILFLWCTPIIPPVPISAAAVAAPIPVVAAPVCDCDSKTHRVFDHPDGQPEKTLSKLGTFPEFGNSHALNATGFYNKLVERYKLNEPGTNDKRFLDEIFNEMGYDGFGEATADDFSEVTLESGVVGNIGGGTMHKTYYRRLAPKDPKDLEAFKITAKNGCDLHFMKTCGNHMFIKPCTGPVEAE